VLVPIEIDTSDITSQFNVTKSEVEAILDNIAKGLAISFLYSLDTTVQQELRSTRSRYLKSVKIIDSGKLQSTVLLDYSKDKLIQMLEEGASSFDMKPKMLGSSKVKIGKSGKKYLTIPFRWATPGSVGESDVFTSKLPPEVYKAVKSNGGAPLRLGDIPSPLNQRKTRTAIQGSDGKVLFDSYQHKNSIYEGVSQSIDPATKQSRYFSFRRVSENSDPAAFIHPGIVAHQFMNKALQSMDTESEVGRLMDVELSKLGF
jgi:hypothetical protein